ncbi:hypothetical protein NEMBOFW57_004545 [Staphylotrichum longicolle]|uniref:Uncharacterized protein n=1 Tax=Staphylotrichum longicolle TaxID=669026 RepID=A0AAD4F9Q1_9PEZI|nr:hypothetical protein NEMBOFW57_004545 [Staphylotrichum longicolle]
MALLSKFWDQDFDAFRFDADPDRPCIALNWSWPRPAWHVIPIHRLNLAAWDLYVLRTSHTLSDQSALWISVERKTALALGSPEEAENTVFNLKQYSGDHDLTFLLIRSFLEWEKERRFKQVDKVVDALQKAVVGYENMPTGPGTSQPLYANGPRGSDNLIGLYMQLCNLKALLSAWRTQLAGFRGHARKLDAGNAESMESPEDYVESLINKYDMEINKCEMSLQGTSLAFQVITARLSRIDTSVALRDGKQMKAIALLTMIFLPATFVTVSNAAAIVLSCTLTLSKPNQTLMAVPTFDFTAIEAIPPWSLYLVIFLPLTAVVLFAYWVWVQHYGNSHLNRQLESEGLV